MYGTNPQEPFLRHDGTSLDVQEIFPTIQGEGPFAGCPATFVRLAGCHLACHFCDTDFLTQRHPAEVDEVVNQVIANRHKLVVLTGGEPMRQNIVPLCVALVGIATVQIETAGSFWPVGEFSQPLVTLCERGDVHIVVSPKAGYVHPQVQRHAATWKYIIQREDPLDEHGLPVLSTQDKTRHQPVARPPSTIKPQDIYLQPCDDGHDPLELQRWCAQVCMKHGYRLSLQQHKILEMP